ncbi:MAG: metal-dependent phosphohydrolase [Bacteroidetes bacterium]|nr:MAG: metal-dependent phosphohydrolase [Bacteroidota bacterium]
MEFYRAKQYIINRLHSELNPNLVYHNLEHTINVYYAAKELARLENVNDYDTLLLLTASLYHDSGMLIDYENHEEESVNICEKELPKFSYSNDEIKIISRLIRKTKLMEKANCILENIICDADLDYLGRDYFFIRSTKLRYEWKLMGKHNYNLVEWLKIQVEFLETHQYYTKSAQRLLEKNKQKAALEIRNLYKICQNS